MTLFLDWLAGNPQEEQLQHQKTRFLDKRSIYSWRFILFNELTVKNISILKVKKGFKRNTRNKTCSLCSHLKENLKIFKNNKGFH